ncbi:MAG: hypothetical protein Q9159_007587 [Coniocarpon cinnabarinum]
MDHPRFGRCNMTRNKSINMIEQCKSLDELLRLLHPGGEGCFGWDFIHLEKHIKTIEFRRGSYRIAAIKAGSGITSQVRFLDTLQTKAIKPYLARGSVASMQPVCSCGHSATPQHIVHQAVQSTPAATLEHAYRFGVELEVFLTPKEHARTPPGTQHVPPGPVTRRTRHHENDNTFQFVEVLVARHNAAVEHTLMDNGVPPPELDFVPQPGYDRWRVKLDDTMSQGIPGAKSLELISPILEVCTWRNTIQQTWGFLQRDYRIDGDRTCSTHCIAQAAIYWEPAWEAILPPERRGNFWARSLYVDHLNFALAGKTRNQSTDMIRRRQSMQSLLKLLHPHGDAYFGWDFYHVMDDLRTIEFRRGAYRYLTLCDFRDPVATDSLSFSSKLTDVLMWISVATSFMFAAMKAGSARRYTGAKPTVRRLHDFIRSGHETMEVADITRLFIMKEHLPSERPIPFDSNPANRALLQANHLPFLEPESETFRRLWLLTQGDVGHLGHGRR